MSHGIIIDKCFLRGASGARVRQLASESRLLMSDALFYELMTTEEPVRSQCFRKLPPGPNPVDLVSHVGTMLRYELDHHQKSGRPSEHRENRGFIFEFNEGLIAGDYDLPGCAQEIVKEHTDELRSDVESYLDRAKVITSFFPDLKATPDSRDEAESTIAQPGSLRMFYQTLESPPGERPLPPLSILTDEWAIYRFFQVQMMFAVDLYVRYNGVVPDTFSTSVYEKLEHDVLDAQLMILGILQGAFATKENKLKRWWSLLCPDGQLYD